MTKSRSIRSKGRVALIRKPKIVNKILVCKPDGIAYLRRGIRRSEDNIKMDVGELKLQEL